jgi:hypothetical protein
VIGGGYSFLPLPCLADGRPNSLAVGYPAVESSDAINAMCGRRRVKSKPSIANPDTSGKKRLLCILATPTRWCTICQGNNKTTWRLSNPPEMPLIGQYPRRTIAHPALHLHVQQARPWTDAHGDKFGPKHQPRYGRIRTRQNRMSLVVVSAASTLHLTGSRSGRRPLVDDTIHHFRDTTICPALVPSCHD